MLHRIRKLYGICSIAALISGCLAGCGKAAENNSVGTQAPEQPGLELSFSVEDYKKKMREDRSSISDCKSRYQEETDAVRKTEYPNIHFEDCRFQPFPDTEELEALTAVTHGITVQESWDTIKNWLESIGKADETDMEKEVRVVSPQLETDDSLEPPYCYAPFYEHMQELDSGEGALINTNKCHIQIASDGIYSMSDGKMTAYLGRTGHAVLDAVADPEGDVVETGTVEELGKKKYPLINGKLSVQEGARMVEAYFTAGTPFPCTEGVSVDIPEVRVFELGDVYGYDYMVRRVYHSVPFARGDYGVRNYDGAYTVMADIKHAYVVDGSGVSAFAGYNESEKLVPLLSGTAMTGLEKSVEILSQNLASYLDVHVESAGLEYLPVAFGSLMDEIIIFPCWHFGGANGTKGGMIQIYADVFTGDIYYYYTNE